MSTREILSKSVEGMTENQEVFINARNLREVGIEPGEEIPAGRPCGVLVGYLREKLATPVVAVAESNDPPAVAEAATDADSDPDDDLEDTADFTLPGEAVGQI